MNEDISLEAIAGTEVSSRLTLRHFSLMNSLLTVLNSTDSDDPSNAIALYLLEHFQHLEDLNVNDIIEACYSSRSSIRRFCQSIGFDNFSGIKESAYEWKRHRDYFVGYVEHADFGPYLAHELSVMTQTINDFVRSGELEALAATIHDAHEVLLVASDFSSMAIRDFQQAMLYVHKVVRILTDSFGSESIFDQLDAKDAVIVISATGNFARVVRRSIEQTSAQCVLVTLNQDDELAEPYESVIYLSCEDFKRSRSVYSKYGINYFFDLLYHTYCACYGELSAAGVD